MFRFFKKLCRVGKNKVVVYMNGKAHYFSSFEKAIPYIIN